ncbi:acyl-coenzyme A thioesterase 1-like [Diadema antillarum]|uniref:acyl-coenzyme A thioesterase 1-like n=1 Tax=Diadema antillarum TaxID=105358 RepID=UPI003A887953
MADEQVTIGASGLEPGQLVVLRSSVKSECGKYSFQAHATYEADSLGRDILEFARRHPRIDHTRIGISGSSMGGSLTLNAVPRLTDFPVRCISVAKCMDILSMYLGLQGPDGFFIHPAPLTRENRYSNVTQDEHGTLWVDPDFSHHVFDAANHEDYVAPVENLTIPTLFLVCGDDQIVPSEKCLTRAAERMRQAGNGHLVDFVHLPGAGHLLYTPYLPLCTESRVYVPGVLDAVYVRWGGEPKLHAEAQVKAWQKMLDFFRQHLGRVEPLRRDWLSSDSE